jgi:Flp pilus assembly protein TadD
MRLALTIAALAVIPIALYARVAAFDYVQADDTDLIRGNLAFLRDLGNVGEAFERSYFEVAGHRSDRRTYYRPLVIVSFMLDAQAGGAEPRVYHVTNAVLHAAAVLLLFALLRRFAAPQAAAFLAALLFAVHPANVQAVAWIPGRNDTLMAVFALLSLLALTKYRETRGPWIRRVPRSPWLWLLLHVAGFAAALFTKESALALIVVFLVLSRTRSLGLLTADLVVAGVWYGLRRAALVGGAGSLGAGDALAAAARNVPDLLVYAGKIVLPLHLSVMPGLTRLDAALGAASVVVLVWLLARVDRTTRLLVLAWLLVFLAPALLIPGLPAYEHRLYVPLMAVMLALSRLPVWSTPGRRRTAAVAALVSVQAVFAALAFAHAGVFRDRYAYWSSATTGTPYAGLAHVNLGQMLEGDGDAARAAEQYRQALAVDPSAPGAHNNLGVLLARDGKLDEAKTHFEREIERHPANADACFNMGLVYKLTGRPDEARPWWERAIAVDPSHLAAHQELAAYYAARGDAERAAAYLERARALQARAR